MYLCIHQQNHFSDQTNTHKTVLKKKNIRRDGKRRFVNLRICVFTNKITASLSSTRKPFCATHFPSPLNRNKLAECIVAGNLARLRRLWRCIPLAKVICFLYPNPQPTLVTPTPRTAAAARRQRGGRGQASPTNPPCSPSIVVALSTQRRRLGGLREVTYFDCLTTTRDLMESGISPSLLSGLLHAQNHLHNVSKTINFCFEHFHSWWLWENLLLSRFDQKYACLQEWMWDTKLIKVEWSWSHWLSFCTWLGIVPWTLKRLVCTGELGMMFHLS